MIYIGVILVVLVLAILRSLFLSKMTLVKPSGPLQVGTSRHDFAHENGEDRVTTVQLWYPASEKCIGTKAKWMIDSSMAKYFTKVTKLPLFITKKLANTETDSILDARLSDSAQTYPVILFSHGYAGFIGQSTTVMQDLASHGYVVCSIGHTDDCFAVTRTNGEVIPMKDEHFKAFHNGDNDAYFDMLIATKELPEAEKAMMEWQYLKEHPLKEALIEKWINEQKCVIEALEKMNNGVIPSKFKGRLDTAHMGCLGHSFGGAVVLNHAFTDASFEEAKIKAVVNMDGFIFGNVNKWVINTPIMLLNASNKLQRHYYSGSVMNKGLFNQCQADAYHISIEDAYHMNFSDLGYVGTLLKLLGVIGKIDNVKMMKITNQCLLSYFDKYLKHDNTVSIEELCKVFKEVNVNQK